MDQRLNPRDPGDWEVDEDPADEPDWDREIGSDTRPVTDADFGAGSGMPSGSGGDFTTSDPGSADQPVEGGEAEVDR